MILMVMETSMLKFLAIIRKLQIEQLMKRIFTTVKNFDQESINGINLMNLIFIKGQRY